MGNVISFIILGLFISSPFLAIGYLMSNESSDLLEEVGNVIANLVGVILVIIAAIALFAIVYGVIFLFSLMSVTLVFTLSVIIIAAIAIFLTVIS